MKRIIFTFVGIALLGAGCLGQLPKEGSEQPRQLGQPEESQEVLAGTDNERADVSEAQNLPECTIAINKDLNVPILKKYEFGGVMGSLFTAIDCGAARAKEVYAASGLSQLEEDFVLFVPWNARHDHVELLERGGFVCDYINNSDNKRVYSGECRLSAGSMLSLKQIKELHAADLDFSYSFFVPNPDPTLRGAFRFEHVISSTDPVCKTEPTPTEIGGLEYPIADAYTSRLTTLGEVFTQFQCGNAPFNEGHRIFEQGSHMELLSAPSAELKKALQRAGFLCDNQYQSHSECTEWTLIRHVPIEYLFPLEHYLEEIKREGCFHCG